MSELRAVPDLALPKVTCLPWCERGGHPGEMFAADQTCCGSGGEIYVGTGDDMIEVYPAAKLGQPATVSLAMFAGHRDAHLALTVDQAEQVHAAFGAALDLARQHDAAEAARGPRQRVPRQNPATAGQRPAVGPEGPGAA
ncbi:MAG: hypothetical protein ACR2GH_23500 [Pseudonocardia sp.]